MPDWKILARRSRWIGNDGPQRLGRDRGKVAHDHLEGVASFQRAQDGADRNPRYADYRHTTANGRVADDVRLVGHVVKLRREECCGKHVGRHGD